MHLSVIIPAYNEEEIIEETLLEVDNFLSKKNYEYEIIVVDDGSLDKTVEIVERFKEFNKNTILIKNARNRGKGAVVRRGLLAATGDFRLFTDADNSAPIAELDKLLPCMTSYDIAVGSRALKNSKIIKPQVFYRRALGYVYKFLIRNISGIKDIHDTQCGFKLFSAKAVNNVLTKCKTNGFSFDSEILIIAKELGYNVKEVPINWADNPASKVKIKGMIGAVYDLFYIRISSIVKTNKVFICLGILLLSFVNLFILSFSRKNYFIDSIQNIGLNGVSAVCLTFLYIIFSYSFLFLYNKKIALNSKNKIVIGLLFLTAFITLPLLSLDVIAYLFGAKNLFLFHTNPYIVNITGVETNNWLKDVGKIWWFNCPYVYGPIFLFITAPALLLNSFGLLWTTYLYKVIVFVAYLLTIYIFAKIIKILKKDSYLAWLYALNPALLIHVVMDGHNDIFVILFLLLALFMIFKNKWAGGVSLFLTSVFIKYNSLIFLPVFWKKDGRFSLKRMLISGLAVVASFLAMFFIFRLNLFNFSYQVNTVLENRCLYHCFPTIIFTDLIFGKYAVLSRRVLFIIFYSFLFFKFLYKKNRLLEFIFWSYIGILFILTKWLTPWAMLLIIPVGLLIDEDFYKLSVLSITIYSLFYFFSPF